MAITVEGVFRDQESLCDDVVENGWSTLTSAQLAWIALAGLGIYGFSMGVHHSMPQAVSSAVKLPLLFALTMAITFPAFHFVSLHLGSKSKPGQTLLLCQNGAAVTSVLAAAFSPIVLFFHYSGSSYPFLVLLHVAVLGFCSAAGAATVSRSLARLREQRGERLAEGAMWCLPAWFFICGVVGTQLAFMMRPFIGSGDEFVLFNTASGNFFEAVLKSFIGMF